LDIEGHISLLRHHSNELDSSSIKSTYQSQNQIGFLYFGTSVSAKARRPIQKLYKDYIRMLSLHVFEDESDPSAKRLIVCRRGYC
jgi:hypothetical protein